MIYALHGDDAQLAVIAKCNKVYGDGDDCASMSRDIGGGFITAAQASCEIDCVDLPTRDLWGPCVGKCYESPVVKFLRTPVGIGAAVVAALAVIFVARKV